LFGLLKALNERLFGDSIKNMELTNELLVEQLSCSASEITVIESLLKTAGENAWGVDSLSTHLATTVSSELALSEDQRTVIVKFWTDNREKIASVLLSRSCFNNKYENLSWRVDMKVASSKYSDINEPTGFFELSTVGPGSGERRPHLFEKLDASSGSSNENSGKGKQNKICFEMNQQELKDTLGTLAGVHAAIEQAMN
jgi:hypothetical protein